LTGSIPHTFAGRGLALLVMVLAAALTQLPPEAATAEAVVTGARQVGEITDRRLSEISGLALAAGRRDVVWAINDSGNPAELHAISLDGTRLASVPVAGVRNWDWEALAAVEHDGQRLLIIGDIGDNRAARRYVSLWFVPEPDLDQLPAEISPVGVVHFVYPGGARDAEGLAVDTSRGRILVLSKRTSPPELYALPLAARSESRRDIVTAALIGPLEGIPEPTAMDLAAAPSVGMYSSQPTGLDFRADTGLVVMTYARPYLYPVKEASELVLALAGPAIAMPMPRLAQAESLVLSGDRLLVTTERLPAPILQLKLPARGVQPGTAPQALPDPSRAAPAASGEAP
jgi:hypothetical protein